MRGGTGMGSPLNRRALTWSSSYPSRSAGQPSGTSSDKVALILNCTATSPGPSWDGTVVTMVDLDLDVIRTFSGETRLLDEDEFELHRVELDYPAWMIDLARQTAAQLMDRVSLR